MAKLTGTSGTISVNGIKIGDVVSWEAETRPTPVADIEALPAGLENVGQPVEEWVGELNRRIREAGRPLDPNSPADLDAVAQWAETTSTPLEGLDTVRWHAEEVQLNTETNRLLVGTPTPPDLMPLLCPLVCDLSGDPLCCAILKQLARHPWEPTHRCALLDRMEELGYDEQRERAEAQFALLTLWFTRLDLLPWQQWPRRARRYLVRAWQNTLRANFGPYE